VSIASESVVSGSATFVFLLKVTIAKDCPGCRLAANARAAAVAPAIASPRMLLLASMTSTMPNWPDWAVLAGTTVTPLTILPFSLTTTAPGAR